MMLGVSSLTGTPQYHGASIICDGCSYPATSSQPAMVLLLRLLEHTAPAQPPFSLIGGDFDVTPDEPHHRAQGHVAMPLRTFESRSPEFGELALHHLDELLIARRQDIPARDRRLIDRFSVLIRDREFSTLIAQPLGALQNLEGFIGSQELVTRWKRCANEKIGHGAGLVTNLT